MNKMQAEIEAILFTMGEPVRAAELAAALLCTEEEAAEAADALKAAYAEEARGIRILKLEDAYQMTTDRDCYDALIRLASRPRRAVLTDVQLETLAIIAYKQPVTKLDIANIRGVNSDHAVNRLVEYGLIREAGRKDAPGRPILFVTTDEFLRRFQIESAAELPELPPERLAEIAEAVYSETGYVPDAQEPGSEDGTEAPAEEDADGSL